MSDAALVIEGLEAGYEPGLPIVRGVSLVEAPVEVRAALGIPAPAIAELLPAIEAVMVRCVNAQIAANHD